MPDIPLPIGAQNAPLARPAPSWDVDHIARALAASRLFHVCTPGCQAAVDAVYVACEESDRWDPYATSGSQGRRLQSAPSGPTDVDCRGSWSDCDASCSRSWTETTARKGGGATCPAAQPCASGDGECDRDTGCDEPPCPTTCKELMRDIVQERGCSHALRPAGGVAAMGVGVAAVLAGRGWL